MVQTLVTPVDLIVGRGTDAMVVYYRVLVGTVADLALSRFPFPQLWSPRRVYILLG